MERSHAGRMQSALLCNAATCNLSSLLCNATAGLLRHGPWSTNRLTAKHRQHLTGWGKGLIARTGKVYHDGKLSSDVGYMHCMFALLRHATSAGTSTDRAAGNV